MMTRAFAFLLLTALRPAAAEAPRPNILIILADDLGYSDPACYGGEIATPNLDALSKGGLRFTQFYNTARCWPSRASILTGYYAQQVRRDTVPGVKSGSAGTRPPWARLLPEMLRPLGYRSYHSGKWHVDGKPLQNGFDHSYVLNDHDRYFAPRSHVEDDVPLPAVAAGSGYYTSTAISDYAVKCLKEHAEKHAAQPFFEYLAFTAPHFPVQAPAEDIARYRDRYLRGWDSMREERWKRMQEMGIGGSTLSAVEREVGPPYAFPEAMKRLGPNEVNRPLPWNELSEAQRKFQAEKMAVHAAMVDRMDREIGRVLDQIRAMGAMENTIVLFLSDNGASAEMMVRGDGHDPAAESGSGATYLSIGPGWSSLANTPFRRHKTWVHEGGISTPFIVHWPRGIAARGELRHAPGHLIDLVPTLMELAGGKPPETAPGKSLVPLFAADGTGTHDSLWWLHEGNRALRAGPWKIVAAGKDSPWELYDLSRDRSESKNLAAAMPEKVRELSERWTRQTEEYSALARTGMASPYQDWPHSGSLYLLTTPEGADLPASAAVVDFPLLVRLHRDFFDFSRAKPRGEDLRFSTRTGVPLAYQIEEWDAAKGTAAVWVRIPRIEGHARQEIRAHWGKADAASESNGKAVFNESNGYLSVWHMNDAMTDEVGTLESKDAGTTTTAGMIGKARHLAGKQGIFCGEKITNYPSADGAHSTEAWFRAEKPNATIIGWGNEGGGRGSKVRMQLRSPPHLRVDSDFSDVAGKSRLTMSEWIHVMHTYTRGSGKIYINGKLDGSSTPMLNIKSPARLWIGGWYHTYDFVGDIDEVRVSKTARSAEWVRLHYENQKPLQTLVGPVIQPGSEFSVSPAQLTMLEGKSAVITAQAGGAQKVYWTLKADGRETLVATDRFVFTFDAGRVTGDRAATLQFKAIYAGEVKTQDIPITIKEDIADPVFTLNAPATWDGRATVEVVGTGAGELKMDWSVSDIAVIKEIAPGKLILKRAQNSGKMTVTATATNGGTPTMRAVTIRVSEPKRDAWIVRTPVKDEKPEEGQFYARDDQNEGTLFYNGTLNEAADSVFLKVYAGGQPCATETVKPGADGSYAFAVKLKPGLIRYKVEFGARSGGNETVLHAVGNLVCGDAYVINGQSNAEATAFGKEDYLFSSEWIRSYGSPQDARTKLWGNAAARSKGGTAQVGYWGMELARRLVESRMMPICIINGAVGGTRIDQHQRNPADPEDAATIYGRLLRRVRQARLTHGIRGVLWHQGENDQGADGPTGGFGWESYRKYFIELSAAWKEDYPNIQRYYIFQIWPKACSMGINGSDNRLREVQRTLPSAFSNMSIMSTLGINPPGTCHYEPAGYAEIARLIWPLVERNNYGTPFPAPITPPDIKRAFYASDKRDEIVLEFDQPVKWDDALAGQFTLDGEKGQVASGAVAGNSVTLKLTAPSAAQKLTYLDSGAWSQKTLLRGENGIAALTFCEVPLSR